MPDALLLVGALLCALLGMGWLALAMDVHWRQVRGATAQSAGVPRLLRMLGFSSLAGSLALCLVADTATMAALVWMMLLTVAAATIAFVLSIRPRLLAPLGFAGGKRSEA